MLEGLPTLSQWIQDSAAVEAQFVVDHACDKRSRPVLMIPPRLKLKSGDAVTVCPVDPSSSVWQLQSHMDGLPLGKLDVERERLMEVLGFCQQLRTDRLSVGVTTVLTSPVGKTTMFVHRTGDWFGIQPLIRLLSGNYITPQAFCLSQTEIDALVLLRWKSIS